MDDDERVADAAVAWLGTIGNADSLMLDKRRATPAAINAYLRCLERIAGESRGVGGVVFEIVRVTSAAAGKIGGFAGSAEWRSEKAVATLKDGWGVRCRSDDGGATMARARGQVAEKVLEGFDQFRRHRRPR
jgi:hypothetical protein